MLRFKTKVHLFFFSKKQFRAKHILSILKLKVALVIHLLDTSFITPVIARLIKSYLCRKMSLFKVNSKQLHNEVLPFI